MTPRPEPAGNPPSRPSYLKDALPRVFVAALCLGAAYATWSTGRGILKTGVYDYVLEASGDHSSVDASGVRREEVHATGDWAREQGVGFVAAAVTLTFWGAIVLWGAAGPLAIRAEWGFVHTILTVLSLGCCATAVFAFYPPWRLGRSLSCDAFYLVLAAFLYLATLRDRVKVLARSQKIFPGLIVSAVLIGAFSTGYLVGIVTGILAGFLLTTHVLLLVPRMRAELWTPADWTA